MQARARLASLPRQMWRQQQQLQGQTARCQWHHHCRLHRPPPAAACAQACERSGLRSGQPRRGGGLMPGCCHQRRQPLGPAASLQSPGGGYQGRLLLEKAMRWAPAPARACGQHPWSAGCWHEGAGSCEATAPPAGPAAAWPAHRHRGWRRRRRLGQDQGAAALASLHRRPRAQLQATGRRHGAQRAELQVPDPAAAAAPPPRPLGQMPQQGHQRGRCLRMRPQPLHRRPRRWGMAAQPLPPPARHLSRLQSSCPAREPW